MTNLNRASQQRLGRQTVRLVMALFVVITVLMSLAMFFVSGSFVTLIFGGITVLVVAVIGVVYTMVKMLMDVDATVTPETVRLGERVKLDFRIVPKRDFTFTSLTFTLTCRERVVRGGGKNSHTYTHEVLHEEREAGQNVPHKRGQPWSYNAEWVIPPDAMNSFSFPSNRIDWAIIVHGDVPNWPDYRKRFDLTVIPEVLR